ncbi:hypothetical protein [Adhaeribacter aquaticus]|uniref:hypothetical protein n=1 Tax=Adhaeribacter aquaticus TaxID=299567 RepID=UPI00040CEDF8|nr:hypothetical protein [Adhaeribacter aquaticus]
MNLKLKIAVVFIFFSLIIFAFDQEESNPGTNVTTSTAPVAPEAIKIGELPKVVNESSGIEIGNAPGTFVTHNDAGNSAEIYTIDAQGKLLATTPLPQIENIDWEDITKDNKGNIYIADTGNNSNKRKKLKIYKLKLENPDEIETIEFEYADRQKKNQNFDYDSEALFWYRSRLYVVTKDREQGVNARLYELPDQPGTYEAKPITNYDIYAPVTSADVSPDGKTLLLLSLGKLHLFNLNGSTDFFASKKGEISLGKVGQTEAAVFTDNRTIVFTNEQRGLFQYKL